MLQQTVRSDSMPNSSYTWKDIITAPRTKDGEKYIYILAFVPQMTTKGDREAGVVPCWWDPEECHWFTDSIDGFVNPTQWLMIIQAPNK
jgi:hypothetical protein